MSSYFISNIELNGIKHYVFFIFRASCLLKGFEVFMWSGHREAGLNDSALHVDISFRL